ncbi:hypothetical protein [Nesterenkonia jeotgali]|uniref:Uncharacterized protein n=1 Tax=Nesterenkonia jeotgali TaxID=317018 RepID=A0A0W8IG78_9MICC|nr:hypothetical protein [Nesterenkonia jeotgali]KUG58954.1 hypothetical protein AVL63_02725 [Nesterenkonia jeotgali]
MSNRLKVRITPAESQRSNFIAYVRNATASDLNTLLKRGGFATFQRGDGSDYWINLDHVYWVKILEEGESED